MLIRFVRSSGSCAAVMLALAAPVSAQPPSPEPAVLWYRSTQGCPDGADFLQRIGDRAPLVRLAEAGDRVDFMVTVAVTPEGASGRLERETDRGTVAIREFEAANCDRVAKVLALNLALALDPDRSTPEAADEPPAPPTAAGSADAEPTATDKGTKRSERRQAPAPEVEQPTPTRVAPRDEKEDREATEVEPARWRVGIQGGAQGGILPGLLARGTAFVEVGGAFEPLLPDLTLRAAAVGAIGSSDTSSGVISQSLLAGRLDICPVSFGGSVLSFRPCVAGEVGQMRASRAYRDSSLWAALGVHGRVMWILASTVAVEAEVGAMFPLSRYDVAAGSTVLYRSAPAGLSGVMGASVGF